MPTHIAYANHHINGTLTYFNVLSNAWCFINFKIYKIHVIFAYELCSTSEQHLNNYTFAHILLHTHIYVYLINA